MSGIGVGPLWQGTPHPSGKAEYPDAYPVGTAIGEHLRVESLLRVAEYRLFHLVNNLGPKWSRRKCWACGNRYNPDGSRSCSYCFTPLRDLRMLLSIRWDVSGYKPWELAVGLRLQHFGLITPVAVYYRDGKMLSIHHYDGERLLIDEPAPWPADRLLTSIHYLATVLLFLHESGVVLRRFRAENILLMPDDTVRVFDLDVLQLTSGAAAVRRHPTEPDRRMVVDLANIGLRLAQPEAKELRALFEQAALGRHGGLYTFGKALEELFDRGGARPSGNRAAVLSDVGLVREHNEDCWTWKRLADDTTAYIVADGMGGHDSGEVASRIACETTSTALSRLPARPSAEATDKAMRDAFLAANQAVIAARRTNGRLGTTLVAAVVTPGRATVANTGDSRAYLMRGGQLRQVSRDHTIAQQLIEAGKATKENVHLNPRGSLLTASIGGEDEDLDVEVQTIQSQPGDRLLLCSDGLWGPVPEAEIARILTTVPGRRDSSLTLVRAATSAGAPDNVTVMVIDLT